MQRNSIVDAMPRNGPVAPQTRGLLSLAIAVIVVLLINTYVHICKFTTDPVIRIDIHGCNTIFNPKDVATNLIEVDAVP